MSQVMEQAAKHFVPVQAPQQIISNPPSPYAPHGFNPNAYLQHVPYLKDHLNIGTLLMLLRQLPKEAPLHLDDSNSYPEMDIHSYRGRPVDMEFSKSKTPVTVGEFLNFLVQSDQQMCEGHRGGVFPVCDTAYLWVGVKGYHLHNALISVGMNLNGSFTLISRPA